MTAQVGQLVRDLLEGDLQTYPDATSSLDEPGWNAFGEIVGAAFYRAVEQRFGPQTQSAQPTESAPVDITGFVAQAAQEYDGTPVAIDLPAAEALVRSVLGDEATVGPVLAELDEPDLARIELVLLHKLIQDGGPDGETVAQLVSSAQTDAARFSGEAGA